MNGISARRPFKGLDDQERSFLASLRGHKNDKATWLAYADWLYDQGRVEESWEAKAKAGLCRVYYLARCVSTKRLLYHRGHFSKNRLLIRLNSDAASGRLDYYDRESGQTVRVALEDVEIIVRVETTQNVLAYPYKETQK